MHHIFNSLVISFCKYIGAIVPGGYFFVVIKKLLLVCVRLAILKVSPHYYNLNMVTLGLTEQWIIFS